MWLLGGDCGGTGNGDQAGNELGSGGDGGGICGGGGSCGGGIGGGGTLRDDPRPESPPPYLDFIYVYDFTIYYITNIIFPISNFQFQL